MSAFTHDQTAIKLHNAIKNAPPRGGAAVAEVSFECVARSEKISVSSRVIGTRFCLGLWRRRS